LALFAPGPVLSPSRITLEYKGKIWPHPDRENAFSRASGGGGVRQLTSIVIFYLFKTTFYINMVQHNVQQTLGEPDTSS
tara:strand:- start:1440 stop:1676 length:237 start_codon:yes stop_codon:yes gene_type:complete